LNCILFSYSIYIYIYIYIYICGGTIKHFKDIVLTTPTFTSEVKANINPSYPPLTHGAYAKLLEHKKKVMEFQHEFSKLKDRFDKLEGKKLDFLLLYLEMNLLADRPRLLA